MKTMDDVGKLFDAESANLWHTMNCHNSRAGFKIPEYQRIYDWSKTKQVKRLLEDCFNGFYLFAKPIEEWEEIYTYLGTIILVHGESEDTYKGNDSLEIVDGQQRLTTLSLLCCALMIVLRYHEKEIENIVDDKMKKLIKDEYETNRKNLYQCVIQDYNTMDSNQVRIPRIVRHDNNRAETKKYSDYKSGIAKFLSDFLEFYRNGNLGDKFDFKLKSSDDGDKSIKDNYEYIEQQIINVIYEAKETDNLECEIIRPKYSISKGGRRLLLRDSDLASDDNIDKRLDQIVNKGLGILGFTRLVQFSRYLTNYVVLTRVETKDEGAAFDIFDALNTTGEPLTALETLKPRIIKYEDTNCGRYDGSYSQTQFQPIEEYLKNSYGETNKRQQATKYIVVAFAMYYEGEKIPLDLSFQRNYLRSTFKKVVDSEKNNKKLGHLYVSALNNVANYREFCWDSSGIEKNLKLTNPKVTKLCLKFISEMNTRLTIPGLTRYWSNPEDENGEIFCEAVKAFTAFIVLRRTATSNTKNIDADFRKMMSDKTVGGSDPLCVGEKFTHRLIDIDDLCNEFKYYLQDKISVHDKESWIQNSIGRSHFTVSKTLCRFLLLIAAHQSKPDENNPGLLIKSDVGSSRYDFLDYEKWMSKSYSTIEHIAPNKRDSGWCSTIYENHYTINLVGNLTLLPVEINSHIGNASWKDKKTYYSLLSDTSQPNRRKKIDTAKKEGVTITKTFERTLLQKGWEYSMVNPISLIDEWSNDAIQNRTRNILDLVWESVAQWLKYDA